VALNVVSTDPRATGYINAGTEILLNKGHWFGTCIRYSVNVTNQLFTLPPQFAVAEKLAVCQWPVNIRNFFYEYQDAGWGLENDPSVTNPQTFSSQAKLRGNYPTFKDIVPGNKIRFQCDVTADVGTPVLVLGLDANGNWVRTMQGGVWADGEAISLSQTPGTTSVTTWSQITGIQMPVTKGQTWLYQWDGTTATLLSNYQYWETNPFYQRYLLPTIANTPTQIDLIGKVSWYPVVNPTDWLIIGYIEALKLACVGVKRYEENFIAEGDGFFQRAVAMLQEELDHYTGSGGVPSISVQGSNIGDIDVVEQLI
jgi:hypothetical protein